MTLNIGGVEIGGDSPCRFVAEISNNHNGSLKRCLRLITAAKQAGADLVKFQCYTPDELVALRGDGPAPAQWGEQGWTMRALYEKAQTPHAWFPEIVAHCEKAGIPWFSSVFGEESLALLESLGCPAYKIARLDNRTGVRWIAKMTGKPVIVSDDKEPALWDGASAFLYCPAGYPTPIENVSLPPFPEWSWTAPYFLGLSSHCIDDRLPIAAVARGAKLLEYHFHLCEEPSELEANISLNQYQFNQMVHDVRAVEGML